MPFCKILPCFCKTIRQPEIICWCDLRTKKTCIHQQHGEYRFARFQAASAAAHAAATAFAVFVFFLVVQNGQFHLFGGRVFLLVDIVYLNGVFAHGFSLKAGLIKRRIIASLHGIGSLKNPPPPVSGCLNPVSSHPFHPTTQPCAIPSAPPATTTTPSTKHSTLPRRSSPCRVASKPCCAGSKP